MRPGERPLSPSTPIGITPPTNDVYIENYFNYIFSYERAGRNEAYRYNEDITDQVLHILEKYKEWGPNSNQYTIMVGNKDSIYLDDPQCLRMIDIRFKNNRIDFYVVFRSWDLYGGFPTNLGGLQMLKEQMAKYLEIEDGYLMAFSKGLHLYKHSWNDALTITGLDIEDTVLFNGGF